MSRKITITRQINIPDQRAAERYRAVPDLGPAILFFSGGTALRRLSKVLIEYTHNSIHIITPFDSGGSSAVLRQEFNMLSIGDIRNRIMALADKSYRGNPEVFSLFAHRLPKNKKPEALRTLLNSMIDGDHQLVAAVNDPLRKIIRNHLQYFDQAASPSFDLRGASIGNLILAGGYINNRHHIDPVIYLFSRLVEARGIVRPALNCNYQLAAELEDGSRVIGQHLLTGKEVAPLDSPVRKLYLVESMEHPQEVNPEIRAKMRQLISTAELLCYPPGSFYSSVIANLLPQGMSDAIAASSAPKVYVPNLGKDPEQLEVNYEDSINILIEYLHKTCNSDADVSQLLTYVLLDPVQAASVSAEGERQLADAGVTIIETPLADSGNPELHDPRLLAEALLSLA